MPPHPSAPRRIPKFRPCCAKPTPAFMLNPQDCVNIMWASRFGTSTSTGLEYQGSTWCPQCKVARHTFRNSQLTYTPHGNLVIGGGLLFTVVVKPPKAAPPKE